MGKWWCVWGEYCENQTFSFIFGVIFQEKGQQISISLIFLIFLGKGVIFIGKGVIFMGKWVNYIFAWMLSIFDISHINLIEVPDSSRNKICSSNKTRFVCVEEDWMVWNHFYIQKKGIQNRPKNWRRNEPNWWLIWCSS